MTRYFAYGSNMNPQRVRERGLAVVRAEAARLPGFRLAFDKASAAGVSGAVQAVAGHACFHYSPGDCVEGVLYWLAGPDEIGRMDRFESTPVNYSREVVQLARASGSVTAWTYVANPAVLRAGLRPPRAYLQHLLAGREYLSADYYATLAAWPCAEDHDGSS